MSQSDLSRPWTPQQRDLGYLIGARAPAFWVCSQEEHRVERALATVVSHMGFRARFWDCHRGVTDLQGEAYALSEFEPSLPPSHPLKAIAAFGGRTERSAWIFRDLHGFLAKDQVIGRAFKNLILGLEEAPEAVQGVIFVLTADSMVPTELDGHLVFMDWALPDKAEVASILDIAAGNAALDGADRTAVIDAAAGLPATDITLSVRRSLAERGEVDPTVVAAEKKRLIDRSGLLQWVDPVEGGLDAVGGLELLKEWLLERRLSFSQEAREYGLQRPRGVLLTGVPGCGKSLSAKAIPLAWGGPALLRLDLGSVKSKYVGESEGQLRRALKVAEAVAPAVLWIDEIEKALAGATSQGDGGVSADALGTLLLWMQERGDERMVFVVATANDAETLPPELLRKGRFDDIFFIDLPHEEERRSILEATILKHKRDPGDFDLAGVAVATNNFTGADVAELLPAAMFAAFADGQREPTTADLLHQAEKVGRSVAGSKTVGNLRQWAKERTRPASRPHRVIASGGAQGVKKVELPSC